MVLRPLAPEHAAELRRIHATTEVARSWGLPEDEFPLADEPEATRFTIVVDGAVAGMIQYGKIRSPRHRPHRSRPAPSARC